MAIKKGDKKRYRIPLELPEEEKPLWRSARGIAVQRGMTIGRYVIEAIREKLERDGALGEKSKKK